MLYDPTEDLSTPTSPNPVEEFMWEEHPIYIFDRTSHGLALSASFLKINVLLTGCGRIRVKKKSQGSTLASYQHYFFTLG